MSKKIILGGLEIRPELVDFAIEMERKLRKNDYKTGWDDLSIHSLVIRINREWEEFYQEYVLFNRCPNINQKEQIEKIREEAIDISNFCMFLCHNYPKVIGEGDIE